MDLCLFICSPGGGQLGYFQCGAILTIGLMSLFCEYMFSFYLDKPLRVELLDNMVKKKICFFKKTVNCFPLAMPVSSGHSASAPPVGVVGFFNFDYFCLCGGISL